MRSRLLFIDHSFHKKTQSSAFFQSALGKSFDVETSYLNPQGNLDRSFLSRALDADRIVLWQMDFLAPIFLAMGKPVVVVPMYDGSANMPTLHWLAQRRAHHVNFSFSLHARVSHLGIKSRLVKYFKEAVSKERIAKFDDGLRVFLWQRRPEDGLHIAAVEQMLGKQMSFLHIHDVPDNADFDRRRFLRRSSYDYELKITNWFAKPDDYFNALNQCNTFICPRRAEGIGMAMLEAMARGMLVLASDEPTHNEYIANWVNGILFNANYPTPTNVGGCASDLAYQAWQSCVVGYQNWLDDADRLVHHVESASSCKPTLTTTDDLADFADELTAAYYGGSTYAGYLHSQQPMIETLSGLDSFAIQALELQG